MRAAELIYDADLLKVYRTESALLVRKEPAPWWGALLLGPFALLLTLAPGPIYLAFAILAVGGSTPGWIVVHVLGTAFSIWVGWHWGKFFACHFAATESTVERLDVRRLRVRGTLAGRLRWTFVLHEPVDVVILVHYLFDTDEKPYVASLQLHEHRPSGTFSGPLYRVLRLERRIMFAAGYEVGADTLDELVAQARPLAEAVGSFLNLPVRIDELGKGTVELPSDPRPSG